MSSLMRITLIGDSILCNHLFNTSHIAKRYLEVKEVSIIQATTFASYLAAFEELPDTDLFLISSLLNQVTDLGETWPSRNINDERTTEIIELIDKMAKPINDLANRDKGKVVVLAPTLRLVPTWVEENADWISNQLRDSLIDKVEWIQLPKIKSDELREDGVHLKEVAQERLRIAIRDIIKERAGKGNKRPRTDDTITVDDNREPMSLSDMLAAQTKQIMDGINVKLDEREKESESKRLKLEEKINQNMVAIARSKEELDGINNCLRRNLVVLRFVRMPQGCVEPVGVKERSELYKNFITSQLTQIHPNNPINIRSIFLIPVPRIEGYLQDMRVTCANVSEAAELKSRILQAKKIQGSVWEEVEVANDPVKSTRVRLFILGQLAKKLREENGDDVTVNRYIDTPTLVFRKDGRITKQMGYVETIIKYHDKISDEVKGKAKRIAGQSFLGSLEQFFIVIKDNEHYAMSDAPRNGNNFRGRVRGGGFRGRGRGTGANSQPLGMLNPTANVQAPAFPQQTISSSPQQQQYQLHTGLPMQQQQLAVPQQQLLGQANTSVASFSNPQIQQQPIGINPVQPTYSNVLQHSQGIWH